MTFTLFPGASWSDHSSNSSMVSSPVPNGSFGSGGTNPYLFPGLGLGLSAISGITSAILNYKNQKEEQKFRRDTYYENLRREDTAVQRRRADLIASGMNPVLAAGQAAQAGAAYNGNEVGFNGDFLTSALGFLRQMQDANGMDLDNKMKAFQLARASDQFEYDKSLRATQTALLTEALDKAQYDNRVLAPLQQQRLNDEHFLATQRGSYNEEFLKSFKDSAAYDKWSHSRVMDFYNGLAEDYKSIPPVLQGADVLDYVKIQKLEDRLKDMDKSGRAGKILRGALDIWDVFRGHK